MIWVQPAPWLTLLRFKLLSLFRLSVFEQAANPEDENSNNAQEHWIIVNSLADKNSFKHKKLIAIKKCADMIQ